MAPIHRHQLAWPSAAGWQKVLVRDWDAPARACLQHWARHGLPLVVTRQPATDDSPAREGAHAAAPTHVALGLCAPNRWQRRRLALQMPLVDLLYLDEFPSLDRVATQLPVADRACARQLSRALLTLGCTARVYGSHGWQQLTGMDQLRPGSDLDVWLSVNDVEQADEAAALLASFAGSTRLDGELIFPGDTAVAWREWQTWRAGRARALLVKRLNGPDAVMQLDALFPHAAVAA